MGALVRVRVWLNRLNHPVCLGCNATSGPGYRPAPRSCWCITRYGLTITWKMSAVRERFSLLEQLALRLLGYRWPSVWVGPQS